MRHNSLAGLGRKLEATLAMCKDLLPWTEEEVSELLNLLRTQSCTPMRPLRWYPALNRLSNMLGYSAIWDTPYVSQKRDRIRETLVDPKVSKEKLSHVSK